MNIYDLTIHTMRNNSPSVAMEIIYLPTGISVKGTSDKSLFMLKKKLMSELEEKIKV